MASRKTNPFLSLLKNANPVIRNENRQIGADSPFSAAQYQKGSLVKDRSGFSFFNSPFNDYNSKIARKQGFIANQIKLSNGQRIIQSVTDSNKGTTIRVNPSAYLKQEAVLKQVKNITPFGNGTREAVFVGDREVNRSVSPLGRPQTVSNKDYVAQYNTTVKTHNDALAPQIAEFEEERRSFAKAKNRALNGYNSKSPHVLNEANKHKTQAPKTKKKSVSGARLSSRGSARGVGLGTGGAGLGI